MRDATSNTKLYISIVIKTIEINPPLILYNIV